MPLPLWNNSQILAQMDSGVDWSSMTITYSFPTFASDMDAGGAGSEGTTFHALGAASKTVARLALQLWDDLIPQSFQETTSTTSDIEIGFASSMDFAHAYYPASGSVWFNSTYSSGYNNLVDPSIGEWGFETYMHELGHAMGLRHMGNYNGADNNGPSSYQDSVVYSIMSYYGPNAASSSPDVADADWTDAFGTGYAAQTPMLNDIMVIQAMYGTSTTTRTDDTVYGFNCNITGATRAIYDFTQNANPIMCLFDSAGTDTLDLSGWNTNSIINLAPGSFSSTNNMTSNISIAYTATIENAVGGAGSDNITGNTIANRLEGGGGADHIAGGGGGDTLVGGAGSDVLDGGDGSDTAVFSGSYTSYTITYNSATLTYSLQDNSGTDFVTTVENFQFADVTKTAGQLLSTDNIAPVLIGSTPTDNATGVVRSANLVLAFSESVQAGSGNILIYNSNGTVARTIAVTDSSQVSVQGTSVTINPSTDLTAGAGYYLMMGSGVVRDLAGNAFAGIDSAATLNFSTAAAADTTAPTLSTRSPSDNATGVSIGANLVLTFSETVQAGLGSIQIFTNAGSLVRTIAITDTSQVSFGGSTVTINPASDLAYSTGYYLTIGSGVIKDAAGNAFAGISGTTAYNFTTTSASTDDFPFSTSTTGVVGTNGIGTLGTVNSVDDQDLFKISMAAGTTYTIELKSTGLNDPYLQLYNPAVTLVASNDDGAGGHNSRITYTAATSGTYYVGAMDLGTATGSYAITAVSNVDDYPYDTNTAGTVSVGGKATSGVVNSTDDDDLFSVTLHAGTTYVFDTVAAAAGLGDSEMTLWSPSLDQLAFDDDSGDGLNSRITYTASTSGTYYLGVTGHAGSIGAYSVSAAQNDDYPWSTDTTGVVTAGGKSGTTGSIDFAGDLDLFSISLVAGQNYVIGMEGSGSKTDALNPYLYLYNPQVQLVAENNDGGGSVNASISFTAPTTGTYYIGAADASGTATGTYTITASVQTDDYPFSTSTSGVVSVGGKATSGAVDFAGDQDLLRVTLAAGASYTFDLARTTGGLADPYLRLYNSSLQLLQYDDDSGGGFNSRITFTAPSAGSYYLGVSDYSTGVGGYTVGAQLLDLTAPLLSSTTPSDNASAVAISSNLTLNFSESVQAGAGTIFIYNQNGTVARAISSNDTSQVTVNGSQVVVNPSSDLSYSTSYYVGVDSGAFRDLAGNAYAGISSTTALNFTTAAPPVLDDYTFTAATTGVVTVGSAPKTGAVNWSNDADLFKVQLQAGTSYQFDLARSAVGGLADPYLQLYSSDFSLLSFDDNSGTAGNSRIVFTPSQGGLYYLGAMDAGAGTGGYGITASALVDDHPWSTGQAPLLASGGSASGKIDFSGDSDLFKAVLEGGKAYDFALTRTANDGLADPWVVIYNSSLAQLSYDDDSGGSLNALLHFTPATSGTYYIGAFDYGGGTGNYTLQLAGTQATGGTPGDDELIGSVFNDTLNGLAGNDFLVGSDGDDVLNGGDGIDIAAYAGLRNEYDIEWGFATATVSDSLGIDGVDTLISIERIEFADEGLAFDLSGHAGTVARILGAVIGPWSVSNPSFAGIGLVLVDGGMAMEDVVQLALDARIGAGASHDDVVRLLYENLTGTLPDAPTLHFFANLLDTGALTPAGLGVLAAQSPDTAANIGLDALAVSGLEYF